MRAWTGDEWEEYVVALLALRYEIGDFIPIPNGGGDLGMDGVGLSDGVVYQCYAPQGEPLDPDVRKKRIIGKIKDDLPKLIQKQKEHTDIFGDITIEKWVLFTPIITTKEIQKSATAEAAKIATSGCAYISPQFRAIVATDDLLTAEKNAIIRSTLFRLELPIDDIQSADVVALQQSIQSSQLVQTLRGKLVKLSTLAAAGKLDKAEVGHLRRYLSGVEVLRKLEKDHAGLFERFIRFKRSYESLLSLRSETYSGAGETHLHAELQNFTEALEKALGETFDPSILSVLAGEAIADWLMRCPLDFPDP